MIRVLPPDQPLYARRRCVIDRCATAYRNRVKSTMSSKLISRDLPNEISLLTKSN